MFKIQHVVEWQEVNVCGDSPQTSFSFYKATTICQSKSLMPLNLLRNLREITGDTTIEVSNKHQKLQNFIAIPPPCNNPHLADFTTCSNTYTHGSRFHDPYDDWEREVICEECDSTEICLCGHLFRLRRFIKHVPTGKICCVGSCCIMKIDPDLGNEMVKGKCIECDNLLCDKTQAYQKRGFCSLECFEIHYPNDDIVRKCKFSECRRYLYTINKLLQNHCNRECKKQHKLECLAPAAPVPAPVPAPVQSTELQEYQQYIKDFFNPNVKVLCDCEKYYIPHKYRTKLDAICLVCYTKREKKYITKSILRYMEKNELIYAQA